MTERTPKTVHLALAALIGAVLAGAILGETRARVSGEKPGEALSLSSSFQTAARKVRPSVLNITTERWIGGNRNNPLVRMAERFFQRRSTPQLERSFGTGFVVRPDGIALTNAHVVSGVKEVLVHLHDGTEVTGHVIGTDPPTDLAVLRLDPRPDGKKYVPVLFGNSDEIEIGDWVLSTGNPFGLGQTVAAGIVSAKGRSRVGIAAYEDFIQTDAMINPGNSGGPLLGLDGKVLGVTTAIATRTGEYSGVGFAIPIKMAREVMAKLLDKGRVVRGFVGVGMQQTTARLMQRLGFSDRKGALINQVLPKGPADGKLKPGDLVLAVDGLIVDSDNRFRYQIAEAEVGKPVTLDVLRGGKEIKVEVTPAERPDKKRKQASKQPAAPQAGVGITCREITPQLARFFRLKWKPADKGVMIVRVSPRSMAARQGIRPGMILQQLEKTAVRTLDDLETAKKSIKKGQVEAQGVLVRVWDGKTSNFVLLQ